MPVLLCVQYNLSTHLLTTTFLCLLDQNLSTISDQFRIWGLCLTAGVLAGSWTYSLTLMLAVVHVCGTETRDSPWHRTPTRPALLEKGAAESRRGAPAHGGAPCAPWVPTIPGCSPHLQPGECLRCKTMVSSSYPLRSPLRSTRTKG